MDIRKYLTEVLTNSVYPTIKNSVEYLGDRIEKSIRDKEYETLSPTDITTPLLRGLEKVENAVESQKFPEYPTEITVGNIGEAKTDLSELISVFREEIKKLDKEVVIKNDLGQLLGLFKSTGDKKDLLKALERIEEKIPTIEQQEVIDYTLLISEVITKLEKLPKTDLAKVESTLSEIKKILEEGKNTRGQIIGRGGGYSSVGMKNATEARINPATEEKQDDMITAINGISGTTTYNYIQSDEDATYKYYGYASSTGWQIKRKTLATGVWELASGAGDYDTAWTNRATQSYSYA